jgi:hypothetical protein
LQSCICDQRHGYFGPAGGPCVLCTPPRLYVNDECQSPKVNPKDDSKKVPEQEQSLYDILGIQRNATKAEIKSAYRRLALKYHPVHV